MKLILAIMISLFTVSAFASDSDRSVKGTLERIELEKNVRCDYIKSTISLCMGYPTEYSLCRYTEKYVCHGAENFTLKLRIKETANSYTRYLKKVVTKVIYK